MKKIIFIFWMFLIITATFGQKEYFGKGIPYTSTIITSDGDDVSHSCKNVMLEKEYLYKNNPLKNVYNRNTETKIIVNTTGTKYSRVLFSVELDMVDIAKIIIIGILIILGIAIVILILKYFLKDLKLKPEKRYLDYYIIFINIIWIIYSRMTFRESMSWKNPYHGIVVVLGLLLALFIYWNSDDMYKVQYFFFFILLEVVIEFCLESVIKFFLVPIASSDSIYSYGSMIDYERLKNLSTIFGVIGAFLTSFSYQCFKKVSYRANKPADKHDGNENNEIENNESENNKDENNES
jgi:hypothetical protein